MQTLLPLYRACIYFFYSEKITIFFIYTDAVLFPVFRTVYSGLHGSRPVRNRVKIIQGSRLLTPT